MQCGLRVKSRLKGNTGIQSNWLHCWSWDLLSGKQVRNILSWPSEPETQIMVSNEVYNQFPKSSTEKTTMQTYLSWLGLGRRTQLNARTNFFFSGTFQNWNTNYTKIFRQYFLTIIGKNGTISGKQSKIVNTHGAYLFSADIISKCMNANVYQAWNRPFFFFFLLNFNHLST